MNIYQLIVAFGIIEVVNLGLVFCVSSDDYSISTLEAFGIINMIEGAIVGFIGFAFGCAWLLSYLGTVQ